MSVRAAIPLLRSCAAILFGLLLVDCRTARTGASDTIWHAPGKAALSYASDGTGAAAFVGAAASPELAAAVESTARIHGASLRGDARLALLAAFCAQEQRSTGQTPPPELVEFVMRHLGVYDPRAELVLLEVPHDDARAALEAALAPRLSASSFTHYGAVLSSQASTTTLAVVLTERTLELLPVPRSLPVAEPIRLRGRVLAAIGNPRIELNVAGAAQSVLSAGPGPEIEVQIPTPRAGVYRVEIVGDAPSGARTLAKLAVYVGVPVPVSFKLAPRSRVLNVSAVAADLLARINAARRAAGLQPLAAHPVLDQVATAHSVDMRDRNFVGHQSPTGGGPADRVARTGLGPTLVLENIVRGQDAQALHDGVLVQPGQRSNMLHASITHVGFGIVEVSDAHGSTLLVTELFAALAAPVDVSSAAPTLVAALNQTRSGRGAPTLSLDAELTRVAEEAAHQFVDTPNISEQAVIDAANTKLQRLSVAYRRVGAVLVLAHSLDEARALEPALDPEVRSVGIGAAQGNRPDRGGHVLAIAVILAWPR